MTQAFHPSLSKTAKEVKLETAYRLVPGGKFPLAQLLWSSQIAYKV